MLNLRKPDDKTEDIKKSAYCLHAMITKINSLIGLSKEDGIVKVLRNDSKLK